jgi:uncharacterized protein (DUF362 family)/NAD-dependent dihydropyrimidine dehydrogenase PreA subunit
MDSQKNDQVKSDIVRPARVAIARCQGYQAEDVKAAMRMAVDDLGGIGKFVSRGEKILLKPNMLSPKPPEEAVTTHPEIVRAMIHLVREAGGTPSVGDTPGGRATERILKNLAESTGIRKVCDEEGVEFVLLIDAEKFPVPNGKVAKSFELASTLRSVDGVISLAKMKTHAFTGLTGAVKNLYGLIPGLRKAEYHMRMQNANAFSEMLVDLAECVRPRLTVMDGIVGMDGDGPAAGRPIKIGLIIASDNVHALDAVFAELVGAEFDCVQTIAIAQRRGLLPRSPPHADVSGGGLDEFRIKDFKMPGSPKPFARIPAAIIRVASEGASRKPVFSKSRCDLCGTCIESCPARALRRGERIPAIDRGKCIRCYCCQELCPNKAIALKRLPARSLGRAAWSRTKRTLGRRIV